MTANAPSVSDARARKILKDETMEDIIMHLHQMIDQKDHEIKVCERIIINHDITHRIYQMYIEDIDRAQTFIDQAIKAISLLKSEIAKHTTDSD